MALSSEQHEIAKVIGYEPLTEDEGWAQYPADVDYQDAPKGAIPCTGNVYREQEGRPPLLLDSNRWQERSLRHAGTVTNSLAGTTCLSLEDIEEWTFDSVCLTPAGDEVEPDHPDSWLNPRSYLIEIFSITSNKPWASIIAEHIAQKDMV
jgi:hypothetical protein